MLFHDLLFLDKILSQTPTLSPRIHCDGDATTLLRSPSDSGRNVSNIQRLNSSTCTTTKDNVSLAKEVLDINVSSQVYNEEDARKLYGKQTYVDPAYKYIYPAVLGVCLLATLFFILVLGKQIRNASSMSRSTLIILLSKGLTDVLTTGFALIEVCFLFEETTGTLGFLPFNSCNTLFVLERMPLAVHAASVWFTVVLTVQGYLCVLRPFGVRQYINVKSSVITVILIFVLTVVMYTFRFFDTVFLAVRIQNLPPFTNKTIETCESKYAEWIQSPALYEALHLWSRIALVKFIPSITISVFVSLMVRALINKHVNKPYTVNKKLQSQRNQLSMVVIVIALIVVVFELSAGIVLAIYACGMSTGHQIFTYDYLKVASFAFDLILHISFVAVFLIYCLMSREIRKTTVSVFIQCYQRIRQ